MTNFKYLRFKNTKKVISKQWLVNRNCKRERSYCHSTTIPSLDSLPNADTRNYGFPHKRRFEK